MKKFKLSEFVTGTSVSHFFEDVKPLTNRQVERLLNQQYKRIEELEKELLELKEGKF